MTVERWGVFELSFIGKTDGNPFTDYTISGSFKSDNESVTVKGFYNGDGVYKIRFMPSYMGEYTYSVCGSFSDEEFHGRFSVTAPSGNNHGPVKVAKKYHFAYADGTPMYPLGTTCYVWNLQSDELIEKTLESLKSSPFNKIRFCVFPKHYDYNLGEPRSYPYVGTPMDSSVLNRDNFWGFDGSTKGNDWDFERFNPKHFEHIEKCILSLCELGIEADIILFHPYDRWGFSQMSARYDDMYLEYVVARFSAYRNVWWSLANEYDLMRKKTHEDWQRFAKVIMENDSYDHLRSIHNCIGFYDHTEPWVTHCSIQRQDIYRTTEYTDEWRSRYDKPVVLDEIAYEGDIQHGWGNITGDELTRRFWEAALRGGYGGHSETYLPSDGILWWSHGGELKGTSYKRIAFLMDILKQTPGLGLKRGQGQWDDVCGVPEDDELAKETGYRIHYYSFMRPSFREFYFEDDVKYVVEVIDTWNMTVENRGVFSGKCRIDLPATPYMAIRVRKA